ncbi:MAG: aldehyde dehydrogenase family protein [Pseudomonadota bacterium]
MNDLTAAASFDLKPGTTAFLSKRRHQLLINNEWIDPPNLDRIDTLDPATGEVLGDIPEAGKAEVEQAVSAARAALTSDAWRGLTGSARSRLLWRMADLMEENIDELSELETLDQGKPLGVGRWAEIPGSVEQFRFFAGQCNRLEGTQIPTSIAYQPPGKRIHAYTRKEPVGVVAAIVPWNSPIIMAAMKLAPALAAGCTVILKPAEDTSLTALRLGELAIEAGFPPGVINILTGRGEKTGKALAKHPGIDKVAFTGSTGVGKQILKYARHNLKRVTLELGGKSPVIVMGDADMEAAIGGAANSIFFNAGQVCVAGSRMYAHRSIYDQLVEGVSAYADGLKLGHGLDETTQCGPLVSKKQQARVLGYIEEGREDGAEVVTGGSALDDPGSFVQPTVVANVGPEMSIVREEIFGPVCVVTPFDETDEVLALANDSDYGLAASIWTESLSTAHHMAEDLQAGTVWINSHSMYDATLPIGGLKQSGWGRESGQQAVENYLETKTVCAVL